MMRHRRLRPLWASIAVAGVALGLSASTTRAFTVPVSCPECDSWPIWLQLLLTLVGTAIAFALLAVPYRLSRRVRSPRGRALLAVGGPILLILALVAGARLLVVALDGPGGSDPGSAAGPQITMPTFVLPRLVPAESP